MAWPRITIKPPHLSREGAEIVVLALIAGGVIWLLGKIIDKGGDGYDLAAFLLVLQAIITAIKDRWTQRGTDRAIEMVGQSAPVNQPGGGLNDANRPAGTSDDPVHTHEEPKL